jgi:hypothetical protein
MARSMMLDEMAQLQAAFPITATRNDFQTAIERDNLLGKPTLSSRQNSYRHLVELYGLDQEQALFRVLRHIDALDSSSFPLMAAVCVFCRDAQLRSSFELLFKDEELLKSLAIKLRSRYNPSTTTIASASAQRQKTGETYPLNSSRLSELFQI